MDEELNILESKKKDADLFEGKSMADVLKEKR